MPEQALENPGKSQGGRSPRGLCWDLLRDGSARSYGSCPSSGPTVRHFHGSCLPPGALLVLPGTWDQGSSAAWQSKEAATQLGELKATQDGSQEPPGPVATGQGSSRERGTGAETYLEKLGFWQQDLKQL